ncbi:MAG: hypothetical protein SFH39_00515 [Candidatus Magnetobacterium sp. LHC-1]
MATSMTEQQILEKIAYKVYRRYKDAGLESDKDRDWRIAQRVYLHFTDPQPDNWLWRMDEDDYAEYKECFDE